MSFVRTLALAVITAGGAVPLGAQTAEKPALQAPVTLTAADSARFLALGSKYTRWFIAGQADSLATGMDPQVLERLGGVEKILEQSAMLAERRGNETKIVEEKLTRRLGRLQFWHAGEFSEMEGDVFVIRWILDEHGKITGAGLGPQSSTPPVD
jgi:hypothetical protein